MKSLITLLFVPTALCFGGIGMMPGGTVPADVNSPEITSAASTALSTLNSEENSNRVLVKVISAQTQVVSGAKYYLDLLVRDGTTVEKCHLELWSQPWLNHYELLVKNCHVISKRAVGSHMLGALEPSQLNGDVQRAVLFAVDALNGKSNSLFRSVVKTVSHVHRQIVAGVKFVFTMNMVETSCRNNNQNTAKGLSECPATNGGMNQHCQVEVLYQAWMTPHYTLLKDHCRNADKLEGPSRIDTTKLNSPLPDMLDILPPLLPNAGVKQPERGREGGQKLFGSDLHDYCHDQVGPFKEFQMKYDKVYTDKMEHEKRFYIFCMNMRKVRKLNESEKGTAVYGATMFADLTDAEFQAYKSKPWDEITNHGKDILKPARIPDVDIPESFDWRKHNAVTAVKNQGSCGSCWAFSTTGNIEGQWAIHKQKLLSLSEQELVDCDKLDDGCGGGLPSNAYKAIMKLGGLESEKAYKYEGDDEKCIFNKTKVVVKINGAVNISSNEKDMAAWLVKNGPISIGINANGMQFYMGGISHPWRIFCNPAHLDHGVLIVGYGVEGSEPFWIIKNSWGPSWGEEGYYRVYRGAGVCGLNTMCTSAVVN
ncbi:cathepsin F-like [Gigantopelta aegis]|uniref:cathepsin F-like n=1 Tax=Gigantopelta aegis TaxID=1735272 RepID=UPI001B88B7AD|nr:cathepsin F-like [Gigantopelta aegis]